MKGMKRILSLVLSTAVLLNTAAFTAIPKADTMNELIQITEFEALSDSILQQDVPLGTTLESLNLPDTLTVTIAPGQTTEEAATEELTTEAIPEATAEELTTAASELSTAQAAEITTEAPAVTTEKATEKEPAVTTEAPKATEADKTTEAPKTTEADKTTEAPKTTEAEKTTEAPKTTEAEKAPEAPASDKSEAGITQKISNEVLSANTFDIPVVTDAPAADVQVPDVQEPQNDGAQTITLTNITWKDLMGNYDPEVKMNHKFVPELPEGYVAQSSIMPIISVNVGKVAEYPSFAEQIEALSNPNGRSITSPETKEDGLTLATAFKISTIADIKLMRDMVNADETNSKTSKKYAEAYYILMNDLDFADETGYWTPIGCLGKDKLAENQGTIIGIFRGYFDGQGHTIFNLKVNPALKYQGLFGYVGATVLRQPKINTVKNVIMDSSSTPNIVGCLTSIGHLLDASGNEMSNGYGHKLSKTSAETIFITNYLASDMAYGRYALDGYVLTDSRGNTKANSPFLYCFNYTAVTPKMASLYLPAEPFTGQTNSNVSSGNDTSAIVDNIKAALYAGFPIDACNYSSILSSSPDPQKDASKATQWVIWTILGQIDSNMVTTAEGWADTAILKEYYTTLLNYAKAGKIDPPKAPTITLSVGKTVDFNEVKEDGFNGYKTKPFYFNVSEKDSTFSLELTGDIKAYRPGSDDSLIKNATEYTSAELKNFNSTMPLVLASTDRPDKPGYALITITNVSYRTPEDVVIYSTPETSLDNLHKEYQKIIGYTVKDNTDYASSDFKFNVKIDGKPVPGEPDKPSPPDSGATTTTPPTTPSNPGTGTTTPPTTVTPPEVIVPDEDTPLAPGPDAYLPDDNDPNSDENKNIEDDTTTDDDTIIDDDEVPLAKLPEDSKKPATTKKDTTKPSVTIDVPEDEVPLANLPKTGQEQNAMSQNAFFMMLGAFGLAAGLSLLAMASKKSLKATKATKRNKK